MGRSSVEKETGSGVEFECFTDGGSQGGRGGSSAAIIREGTGGEIKLAAYLGDATNNEAEIIGLLLALAFLRAVAPRGAVVRWVADSEYTIKSATEYINNWQRNGWRTASKEPVKNQGLWKTYLRIVKGISLMPVHVRGHTGHPENEACDLACQWIRSEHDRLVQEEGKPIELADGLDSTPWVFVDGRGMIELLRTVENPSDEAAEALSELLANLSLTSFQAVAGVGSISREERDARKVRSKFDELRKMVAETALRDSLKLELIADLERVQRKISG